MPKSQRPAYDRREFLQRGLALGGGLAAFGVFGSALTSCASTNQASSGVQPSGSGSCKIDPNVTISIVNAGGDETKAITTGYVDPFTKATGCHATFDPPNDFGRLQAMVKSGNPTADIFNVDGVHMDYCIKNNLLDKIDYAAVAPAPSVAGAQNPYGLGFQYYSTIMAWKKAAGAGQGPQTWADFFDVKKFPGRRGLCDFPQFTLPAALLADGVPADKLYPLDIERGIGVLNRIKGSVAVWWTSGAQSTQILSDGSVDFANCWSGRVANAVNGGTDLGFTFNQGLLDLAYMCIPRGSAHSCEVFAFLHQVSLPQNQAAAAKILPYSGPAQGIDGYLPQNILQFMPTSKANLSVAVKQDEVAYSQQSDDIDKAWQKFKLSV